MTVKHLNVIYWTCGVVHKEVYRNRTNPGIEKNYPPDKIFIMRAAYSLNWDFITKRYGGDKYPAAEKVELRELLLEDFRAFWKKHLH